MPPKKKDETVYPTATLDAESRLERLENPPRPDYDNEVLNPEKVYAPFATEDTETDAYVGVSEEYVTHADVRQQPFAAEGGTEAKLEEYLLGGPVLVPESRGYVQHEPAQPVEGIFTATSGENNSSTLIKQDELNKTRVETESISPAPTPTPSPAPAPTPTPTPNTNS